jgi:5'-nucleotidase
MTKKPHILITNDDGIYAKGIKHLWQALEEFAHVSIIAPASEKSGTGVSITLKDPIHIENIRWEKETPAWKVSGTPADCIRMALSVILDQPPDLIVSGINRGANSGRNVFCSGTIGGVIEGALRGIPGIAFSSVDFENPDFLSAQKCVLPIVRYLLEHPFSKGTLLNVNVPTGATKGLKLARQGMGSWIENPDKRLHPDGIPYYWHGGKWDEHNEHDQSDVALLQLGYTTAVPLHISELTDHEILKTRKALFEEKCN